MIVQGIGNADEHPSQRNGAPMLDNSLKPRLGLKFPPPQPPAMQTAGGLHASSPPPAPLPKIAEGPPPEPKKAKKEKFRLTYLLKDGREWGSPNTCQRFELAVTRADGSPWKPPKPKKPSRQRYEARKLLTRRDGWIDKVIAIAIEQGVAHAFATEHRSVVLDAFARRLSKCEAVEELIAELQKGSP